MRALELWGGVECTVNRVGARYIDQLHRSGHAARIDDLNRFAEIGITALRCPILWERLAPRGLSEIDWTWADRYLARVRELRMTPIVGLVHHGSGPAHTSLLDDRFPAQLAEYAAAAAERFPWVEAWTPVNEPLTTARFSALYGHWYPHAREDRLFVRALLNQLRGVVLAMRAVRNVNPHARLVQTEDTGACYGTPGLQQQVQHEQDRRWLTWDLLCGRVDEQHPLYAFLRGAGASACDLTFFVEHPCPPEVLGVNYYVTSDRWLDDRLDLYSPSVQGGNGRMQYADVEAVRASAHGLVGHHTHLLDAWNRYGLPVALTEVHLGCTREEQLRWFAEAWQGALCARAQGADVRAVTAWALLGSYDWDSLVTSDAGHYEPGLFELRSPTPRPTALAALARDLAAGRMPNHPVLRHDGWWKRPARLLGNSDAHEASLSSTGAPPLLLVGIGKQSTLSRAFARACAQRGLHAHLASGAEIELSSPGQVEALLRHVDPWAIIDARDHGCIDQAEADDARCWRDNVAAPVTLAAGCRRHEVPLVTFSSGLVFDGNKRRPYVEADRPAPLNAYAAAKAEAEGWVLALLPQALVVRTGAFFSPWDDTNVAAAIMRSLSEGRPVHAADDCTVSLTYVPDLVDAVLDLLIDGERGIWHLANDGAVTWRRFAQMLARRASLREKLVIARSRRRMCHAACPPYSALGSIRGNLLPSLELAVSRYVPEVTARAADRKPAGHSVQSGR